MFRPKVSKQAVQQWPQQLPVHRLVQLARTGRWTIDELYPEILDLLKKRPFQDDVLFAKRISWQWHYGEDF
jgi:hypothetical protein